MQKRQIGKSSLQVPVLCLGGNVFGWTVDERESFRLLDAALDAGLNFIDTADVYSRWVSGHVGGESETVIGKWFARSGRRSQVVLATKLGFDMGDDKKGLSRKYIAEAVEASLRRLQTDYIDLYQSHTDDKETPLEETLSAFDTLVDQGKVRVIGASNYSGARLKEAIEISQKNNLARYECLQPNYSLVERSAFESDLLPVVEAYDIGVIPYFSLAAGFLTGQVSLEAGCRRQGARPDGGKVSERSRLCGARRAGCRGSGSALDAGAGRSRVADRETRQSLRPSPALPRSINSTIWRKQRG